jgi:dTDP-glucose 4,6-dehydratase
MRHIITGGAGFTARHLTAALTKRNEHVVLFDIEPSGSNFPDLEYIRGDIRDSDDLTRLQLDSKDVVYHLAARQFHADVPVRNQQDWFADVNVTGTRRLLEAMKRAGATRLIFFSTDMTYGRPKEIPVRPYHPKHPIGPYGRSKLRAEQLIEWAVSDFRLRATIFRPRLIAGAGRLGILARLFSFIERDLPIPLVGSGSNRYQMVAVQDCVSAALEAMERDCPLGPFNLGSNEPPTVRMLLKEVIRRAGSRSKVFSIPAPLAQGSLSLLNFVGLPILHPEQFALANLDFVLDVSTTAAALGWNATRSDQDIVHEAYEHYLQNKPKRTHARFPRNREKEE